MMKGSLFLFVLCSLIYLSAAQFSPEKHEMLGWVKQASPVSDATTIKFSLYLKQQNLHVLEKYFWEVSNPKSDVYGKYLSSKQVTDIVSPSKETLARVTKWLLDNHITNFEFVENRDVVAVYASASTVKQMMNVNLHTFQHSVTGKSVVRADAMYTIPSHLRNDIDFIRGVSNFPMVSHRLLEEKQSEVKYGDPVFDRIRGRNNEFMVSFVPTCLSSNASTTTIPPCQDYPPVLNSVTVNVFSMLDTLEASFTATAAPECVNEDGTIICTVNVQAVNYALFNVSIQSTFEGGKQSNFVNYAYPAMASPALTPQSIKSYYNIPFNQKCTHNVTQAVGEFEQQYYDEQDLLLFFDEMGLPYDTPVTVVGPNNQSNPGVEANLDIQYIMAIGVGAPTTFWSIYANSSLEIDDILAWAVAMSNASNPPIVNSLSYGMTEDAVDLFLGVGYLNRSDVEFQKLATRGITIIIADGDAGAGDLGPPPMSANTCMPLHADWPSQSPFVTAVSATMFTPLAEEICYLPQAQGGVDCSSNPLGEVPTSVLLGTPWTTGGGFANTSARPSYQDDFVTKYLATLQHYNALPPAAYFNAQGRAYPDVAMVGHNLLIAQSNSFMTVDGTSASAPVFAGFVSLLNDIRVAAGKPMLGFLNPMLYQIARDHPEAYNDVVFGSNRCGDVGFTPTCCPYGYDAMPGFDAVSGLGSPNFAVFKEIILNY